MKSTFVDTSAFVALVDRKDRNHQAAKRTLKALAKARTPLITSAYIADEVRRSLSTAPTSQRPASRSFRASDRKHATPRSRPGRVPARLRLCRTQTRAEHRRDPGVSRRGGLRKLPTWRAGGDGDT